VFFSFGKLLELDFEPRQLERSR